jgi:hypothetical protein
MASSSPNNHGLAKVQLDLARAYIQRGRRFELESVEELQRRFIQGMNQLANCFPRKFVGQVDFRDVIAEYGLRGIKEPLDLVRPQMNRITDDCKARRKPGLTGN